MSELFNNDKFDKNRRISTVIAPDRPAAAGGGSRPEAPKEEEKNERPRKRGRKTLIAVGATAAAGALVATGAWLSSLGGDRDEPTPNQPVPAAPAEEVPAGEEPVEQAPETPVEAGELPTTEEFAELYANNPEQITAAVTIPIETVTNADGTINWDLAVDTLLAAQEAQVNAGSSYEELLQAYEESDVLDLEAIAPTVTSKYDALFEAGYGAPALSNGNADVRADHANQGLAALKQIAKNDWQAPAIPARTEYTRDGAVTILDDTARDAKIQYPVRQTDNFFSSGAYNEGRDAESAGRSTDMNDTANYYAHIVKDDGNLRVDVIEQVE